MSPELEFLERVPLFNGLNSNQLMSIQGILKKRTWPAGEIILHEGESGQSVYILVSGTVQISKKLSLGNDREEMEKSLVHLQAQEPEVLGEAGLLGNGARAATVATVKPCEAYEIGRDEFLKLCEIDPMLGYLTMRNLALILEARLRKTSQDVLKLATALSIALGH